MEDPNFPRCPPPRPRLRRHYCVNTPNFHNRVNAKKGYTSYQGYSRGVPSISTTGSTPKKGIPLIEATVGGLTPIFTTGSTPKKGIPLIKVAVRGYPQFSLSGQRQKRVYLLSRLRVGGLPQFSIPGQCQNTVNRLSRLRYCSIKPPVFTTGSTPKKGIPLIKATVGGYPIFTAVSTPKNGIPLIKATVGGYPQFPSYHTIPYHTILARVTLYLTLTNTCWAICFGAAYLTNHPTGGDSCRKKKQLETL